MGLMDEIMELVGERMELMEDKWGLMNGITELISRSSALMDDLMELMSENAELFYHSSALIDDRWELISDIIAAICRQYAPVYKNSVSINSTKFLLRQSSFVTSYLFSFS